MVRKGRGFEETVSRLEEILNDSDIAIKSPDWITDKTNPKGKKREVDISLRRTVGSKKILIILECRDRKDDENVIWIEQLVCKRNDIGADKAIAISSRGFTEGAKRKAKHHGIELRTLGEIGKEMILDWFQSRSITVRRSVFDIKRIRFEYGDKQLDGDQESCLNRLSNQFPVKEKCFYLEGKSSPFSLNDLVRMNDKFQSLFDGLNHRIGPKERKLKLVPENEGSDIIFSLDGVRIEIKNIFLILEVKCEILELPFSSIREYKQTDQGCYQVLRTQENTLWELNQSLEITLEQGSKPEQQKIYVRTLTRPEDLSKDEETARKEPSE